MTGLKPNVALIIPGGIGTGKNNIGVPILERVVKLMSLDYKITVFQLHKTNENYTAEDFELIDSYSPNRIVKIVKFLLIFRKVQRLRKFKAVHGFWAFPCGVLAVMVGRIFRIKSLISLQGGDAISLPEIKYGQLQAWLPREIVLWALHHVDVLISPTKYLIYNLQKFGFNRKDTKFIPFGVDLSLFKFQNKSISNPVQFLHIANLHPVKDQSTLLRAFQIISNQISCQLTIIGEGISGEEIRSLAEELKIRQKIIFLEPMPYESLPAYYHQADVLLHTSLSEGQALVVVEAMSCGVLVSGTDVGLLYDLPDCCISVPIADYESLAKETLKTISEPERFKSIQERAHSWAKAHSIGWTVERIKSLYAS
jgi:glycosyltransferase involved in cell wall biosynthesis